MQWGPSLGHFVMCVSVAVIGHGASWRRNTDDPLAASPAATGVFLKHSKKSGQPAASSLGMQG